MLPCAAHHQAAITLRPSLSPVVRETARDSVATDVSCFQSVTSLPIWVSFGARRTACGESVVDVQYTQDTKKGRQGRGEEGGGVAVQMNETQWGGVFLFYTECHEGHCTRANRNQLKALKGEPEGRHKVA